MSELWSVRVLDRTEHSVRLRVTSIHPDAGEPPGTDTFAFRLLAEGYLLLGGTPDRDGKLGAGPEQWTDDAWVRRNLPDVVRSVSVDDVRHAPTDETTIKERIGAELDQRGIAADDGRREALTDEAWQRWWQDPDNLPAATYEISVVDPVWIERFEPGLEFNSAAYG